MGVYIDSNSSACGSATQKDGNDVPKIKLIH